MVLAIQLLEVPPLICVVVLCWASVGNTIGGVGRVNGGSVQVHVRNVHYVIGGATKQLVQLHVSHCWINIKVNKGFNIGGVSGNKKNQ